MVIGRIREHVAAHNWFAVAVDVGIVVLGVFLGTQVNNWNEDRLDRSKAENFRARLVDELDFDVRQYALQHSNYRQARSYGQAALADLNGVKPLSDSDFLIAAYQLTQVDTTRAKTGVYQEMAAAELVGESASRSPDQIFSTRLDLTESAMTVMEPRFGRRLVARLHFFSATGLSRWPSRQPSRSSWSALLTPASSM